MSKDYAGGARSGADGNSRLLKEYGGSKGSDGMSKCYAHGGSVHHKAMGEHGQSKDGHKPHKAEGGEVEGMAAKPRLDRPGRKMKGKGKDKAKGTNVNVIIMSGKDGAPGAAMAGPGGPPPGAGPMPPPMMKPPGPPMPPPGAGGPPGMPPMHKDGGKVHAYKNGGSIKAEGQTSATEAEAEKEETEGRKDGGKVQKKADGGPTTKYREMKNSKASEYDRAGISNGLTGLFTGNKDLLKQSLGNYSTANDIRGQGAAVEDLINRGRGEDLGSKAERWAPPHKSGGKVIASGQTSPAESEAENAKKHGGKVSKSHKADGGLIGLDAGNPTAAVGNAAKRALISEIGGDISRDTSRANGGRAPRPAGGAGGGLGRLEKIKEYGK